MATRSHSGLVYTEAGDFSVVWEGITEADEGNSVSIPRPADLAVQTIGDFTSSGAVTLQGSNDGTNWGTLKDVAGNDIVMDAATKVFQLRAHPRYIRPKATAGSSVDMDTYLYGVPYKN